MVQAHEKTIFSVQPPSAQLLPQQSLKLTVTAILTNPIKISDRLTIVVPRGVNFAISLQAEGTGTTIVSDPPLQPRVNLGTYFSCVPCENQFTLTNRGCRKHSLFWSTDSFSVSKMKKAQLHRRSQDLRDMKVMKRLSVAQEIDTDVIQVPVFEMRPSKFELEPLQSMTVKLVGYSDK